MREIAIIIEVPGGMSEGTKFNLTIDGITKGYLYKEDVMKQIEKEINLAPKKNS